VRVWQRGKNFIDDNSDGYFETSIIAAIYFEDSKHSNGIFLSPEESFFLRRLKRYAEVYICWLAAGFDVIEMS
jgi:hypothetical protein